MNICHSIVLLLLVCFIPQLALAGEGQLVSDTVHSRALEGNLLGGYRRSQRPRLPAAKL
jgi:hypothetical protein